MHKVVYVIMLDTKKVKVCKLVDNITPLFYGQQQESLFGLENLATL